MIERRRTPTPNPATTPPANPAPNPFDIWLEPYVGLGRILIGAVGDIRAARRVPTPPAIPSARAKRFLTRYRVACVVFTVGFMLYTFGHTWPS